jgi:hypothetical protein
MAMLTLSFQILGYFFTNINIKRKICTFSYIMNPSTHNSQFNLLMLALGAIVVVTSGYYHNELNNNDFVHSLIVPFSFMPIAGLLFFSRTRIFHKIKHRLLNNLITENLRALKKLWF